jgi:microcystin-dependent protein
MKFVNYLVTTLTVALLLLGANALIPVRTHAQLAGIQTWGGTAGGTANALTLTVHNVGGIGDLLGVPIRFLPSANNTGPASLTINLDGGGTIGPTAIQRPTSNLGLQALSGKELQTAGQPTEVVFNGVVFAITSSIDMTPVGAVVDFRANSPGGYLIEDGSCVSQTTFAALFAVIGTTYGGACGGGLFPVPDSRGTNTMALDGQGVNGLANRITSASCGSPNTLGSLCGNQQQTLTQAQLPFAGLTVTGSTAGLTVSGTTAGLSVSGTVNVTSSVATINEGVVNTPVQGGSTYTVAGPSLQSAVNSSGSNTLTGAGVSVSATGAGVSINGTTGAMGSGTAHPILNPTVLAYRMIKY